MNMYLQIWLPNNHTPDGDTRIFLHLALKRECCKHLDLRNWIYESNRNKATFTWIDSLYPSIATLNLCPLFDVTKIRNWKTRWPSDLN